MSLDKAIESGKEHRKLNPRLARQLRRFGHYDPWCAPHGNCGYCKEGRMHKNKRRGFTVKEELDFYGGDLYYARRGINTDQQVLKEYE